METSDYLEKAHHNEEFLSTIDKNKFADWYVTVCFYVSLHYVNAFISRKMKSGFCSHEKVKRILHPEGSFVDLRMDKDAYLDYLQLQNLSRKARYMQIGDASETICKKMKPRHADSASSLMSSVKNYIKKIL